MNNIYRSLVVKLLILLLFLFSCSCAGVAHKRNSFDFPIESFVKFEYTLYNKVCEPENSNTFSSKCFKPLTGATGSGSIISKSYDGAYILTAAHMCKIKVDPMLSALMIDEEGNSRLVKKFWIYDIDMFKYEAHVVGYDIGLDSCIAFVYGLTNPPLKIAKHGPKKGEKVWNMAAPAGFSGEHLVPFFDGYYSGHDSRSNAAIYTIPAVGGSSGSPIMNSQGEVIGIIYARLSRFHHITISPPYKGLRNFILETIRKDALRKQSEQDASNKKISIKISN